jgi:hypothetical protein
MRKSITQKLDFGCGVACFAFALGISYTEAEKLLGPEQSSSNRFWIKDFVEELSKHGKPYKAMHVKEKLKSKIYSEGTIVLIRRSKHYPSGHYLIRHNNTWMDPWINLPYNKNILQAESGFRKRLPGTPMYALFLNPKS